MTDQEQITPDAVPMIDRFIDRVVIRADDPREPTQGFIKYRALLAAIVPPLPIYFIAHTLPLYGGQITALALYAVIVWLWMGRIAYRINQRIERLETHD